jgi:hypothetical protein
MKIEAEMSLGAATSLVMGIRLRAEKVRRMAEVQPSPYWTQEGRDLLEAARALGWENAIKHHLGHIPESWKPEVPA